MRQHHVGVWRPVAVVAAVERARRPVDSELNPHHAAHPEGHLRLATLVHRTVAEKPEVGLEELRVAGEHLPQVRRTRFLLTLEEELQVDAGPHPQGPQRIEGAEHRDDRGFVVAGRAGVDACLVGERVFRMHPCNRRRAVIHLSGPQHRLERRRLPRRLGPDRLAVEVADQKECPPRALRTELAVHRDGCARRFEDAGSDAALFQRPDQGLGIAPGCRTRSRRCSAGRGVRAARRRWPPRGRRRRSRRQQLPATRQPPPASWRMRAKPGQRRNRGARDNDLMAMTPPPIEMPVRNHAVDTRWGSARLPSRPP